MKKRVYLIITGLTLIISCVGLAITTNLQLSSTNSYGNLNYSIALFMVFIILSMLRLFYYYSKKKIW